MSSLLPGYEYDIFISYRQNDNRSGWVTDFVKALQEELAATIKDPVTVYFDTNPHDGLLETHNVDKSLEGKLKCLLFIPIISQTYCDPKSFAWQHEFCAFNSLAKEDALGLDIKLGNGNVTSRILPIKIHDLDPEDQTLLEKELGSVLRAIEFIYKEAGVNRPLKPVDHKADNQNRTDYRNQVNKVANAVKEITSSLKKPATAPSPVPGNPDRLPNTGNPPASPKKKVFLSFFLLVFLFATGYYFYPKLLPTPALDKSIAVLPFVDMSPAHDQEYFGDGVAEEIINVLAQSEGLKVIARSSSFQFKGKNEDLKKVGEMLGVATVLEGSIRKSADKIRVTAQLIKASDGSHIWSKTFDRTTTDIFAVQDEIAAAIATALNTTLGGQHLKSQDPEAYEHYLKGEYIHGNYYYVSFKEEDFKKSEQEFLKAIALDSTYALAYAGLSNLYDTHSHFAEKDKYEEMRNQYARRAYALAPQLPYCLLVHYYSFTRHEAYTNTDSAFKYIKRGYEYGPNSSLLCSEFGAFYLRLGLYTLALPFIERSMQLSPASSSRYSMLAGAYTSLDSLDKAAMYLSTAEKLEPRSLLTLLERTQLNFLRQDPLSVDSLLERIRNVNPDMDSVVLAGIVSNYRGWLLALKGEKEKALRIDSGAITYLTLGLRKEAMARLEKERRGYLDLLNNRLLNGLRGERRFAALLEKARIEYEVNLAKYRFSPAMR